MRTNSTDTHIVLALALLAFPPLAAFAQDGLKPGIQHDIAPHKELLITDPKVVDSHMADYPNAFSIGHLFDELAADGDGATLMRNWLETWTRRLVVNGAEVVARPKMKELVIEPWQRADGWDPGSGEQWRPDLANAPFRLLAVVNRMDLTTLAPIYYGAGTLATAAPEGRLVYAVLGAGGEPLGRHFTVIFEYEFSRADARSIASVAQAWHQLGAMEFDGGYLDHLATLTRRFTDRSVDKKGLDVAPPLAQVRSNDMALAKVCEMREFKLSKDCKVLVPSTLAGTPSMKFADRGSRLQRVLGSYIAKNMESAKDGSITFPVVLRDRGGKRISVLSGSALIPSKRFHWASTYITDPEARHNFSLRTCSGCHAGDSNTEFCHISPRRRGEASELSDFLRLDGRPLIIADPAKHGRTVESTEMADRIGAYAKVLDPGLREAELKRVVRKARVR